MQYLLLIPLLVFILIPIALGIIEWRVKNRPLKVVLAIVLLFTGYHYNLKLNDLVRGFDEYHYNRVAGQTLYEIKTALEKGNQTELLELLEEKGQGDLFYSPETDQIRSLGEDIQELNVSGEEISE